MVYYNLFEKKQKLYPNCGHSKRIDFLRKSLDSISIYYYDFKHNKESLYL